MTPTADDAKRYCPMNSKCRGDNQMALCQDDYEVGTCQLDHEECNYKKCTILANILKAGAP